MSGTGLEVRQLRAGYPPMTVLHGVDLVAPPGAVTAILGPNGAGKTTLLRSVFGLTEVFSGTISFDGVDLGSKPRHVLADLGLCYITEGRAIYRSLTVSENLAMFAGGRASGDQLERVFDVLPKLAQRRQQESGTMSGGEQQMLAIARTLINPWKFLLIDEVSMGLAPVIIDELFQVLALLQREGTSILLVEQYAERALEIAEVVYVLASGSVRFAGEPAELSRPESNLLELYLGGDSGAEVLGNESHRSPEPAVPPPPPQGKRRSDPRTRPLRAR